MPNTGATILTASSASSNMNTIGRADIPRWHRDLAGRGAHGANGEDLARHGICFQSGARPPGADSQNVVDRAIDRRRDACFARRAPKYPPIPPAPITAIFIAILPLH